MISINNYNNLNEEYYVTINCISVLYRSESLKQKGRLDSTMESNDDQLQSDNKKKKLILSEEAKIILPAIKVNIILVFF